MKRIFATALCAVAFAGFSHRGALCQTIASPNAPAAIGPYSQAVRAGDVLYLSGQLGLDPATGELGTSFAAQARQALKNQEAILEAAGFSLGDVVQCQVFLTDMENYREFNDIYSEYFTEDFPARAVLEVSRIPADGLVEIMMVAVRNE